MLKCPEWVRVRARSPGVPREDAGVCVVAVAGVSRARARLGVDRVIKSHCFAFSEHEIITLADERVTRRNDVTARPHDRRRYFYYYILCIIFVRTVNTRVQSERRRNKGRAPDVRTRAKGLTFLERKDRDKY